MTARLVTPFLGYQGLYVDSKLVAKSNHPVKESHVNPRAVYLRSRPLSMQPLSSGVKSLGLSSPSRSSPNKHATTPTRLFPHHHRQQGDNPLQKVDEDSQSADDYPVHPGGSNIATLAIHAQQTVDDSAAVARRKPTVTEDKTTNPLHLLRQDAVDFEVFASNTSNTKQRQHCRAADRGSMFYMD